MADVASHGQMQPPPTPQSGHSMTTRSNDGGPAQHPDDQHRSQEQQSSPTAVTTPNRPTRKRAASINVQEANRPRIENLALNTPLSYGGNSSHGPAELICLCAKPRKIPRPRNVFMLYRQSRHGEVVKKYPGVSNPEISKIIGDMWKNETDEIKQKWSKLAEEEKLRHQQQYPGYRYQPRRNGKNAESKQPGSGEGSARCPQCGGVDITASRSPPLSSAASNASKSAMPTSANTYPMEGPFRPRSPSTGYSQDRRDSYYALDEDENYNQVSPASDYKRRRFDSRGSFQSMASPYDHAGWSSQPPAYATSAAPYSPTPLPGPSVLLHQNAPMPSNRRPSASIGREAQPRSRAGISLHLPPIQTHGHRGSVHMKTPDQVAPPSKTGFHGPAQDSQALGAAAMIMSINYIKKVEALSRTSPPLTPPGPDSPAAETRGPVIAIDGTDARLMREVSQVVQEAISKSSDFSLRTWSGRLTDEAPNADSEEQTREGRGRGEERADAGTPDGESSIASYLDTIKDWHSKSLDIVKHITTAPAREASSSEVGSQGSESTARTVPVALITDGFSLSTSDRFATKIPINDRYDPVGHWQWVASMWRGIVGFDLVIYAHYVTPGTTAGVELTGPNLMSVRVPENKEIDESTKRRLAFEVNEWVRMGDFRIRL